MYGDKQGEKCENTGKVTFGVRYRDPGYPSHFEKNSKLFKIEKVQTLKIDFNVLEGAY